MTYPATILIPLLRQVDAWLEQCVRSALTQTISSEVIVVRSELTPPSNLDVLAKLGSTFSNLRILVEDMPGSFPAAINQGIRHASADRVGLLLSDDWLEQEAIAATINHPADIVSTGYTVHFADGRVNALASKSPSIAAFIASPTLEEKANFLKHFFLLRRNAVLSAGGLDESIGNYPGIDDYDLIWTLLERGATVAIVPRRLYHYRDHEKERLTLHNADAMICNLRKILRKHGVPETQTESIVAKHAPWYGHPIFKVLNERQELNGKRTFASFFNFASWARLNSFSLEGTAASEHVDDWVASAYRAPAPAGSTRGPQIRPLFAWLRTITLGCSWCFGLLRSRYRWMRTPTLFVAQWQFSVAQLIRVILEGRGGPASEVVPKAAVRALAEPRDPTYTPVPNRILMVTSTFGLGGSERQMMATASALLESGYDVRFIALGRTALDTPTIEHEILKLGVEPEHAADFCYSEISHRPSLASDPLQRISELPRWFWARAGAVVSAVRKHRPAVVHCWLEMPGIIAALTACAMGVPRVVLGQRNAPSHMEGAGFTQDLKELLGVAYPALAANRKAVILNNTASAARQYEVRFGLEPNTIRVLYNGFERHTLRTPSVAEVRKFRARFGLMTHVPIVGTLMRFVRNKDPELWVDVAAKVASAKPEVHFLIGGYGEMEGAIARRIEAHGMGDHVTLLGPVTDTSLFYAAVDVVLLTSLSEGTPNVLIEAQAAGRPVVAPAVGGVAETMINGLSGYVVPVRSAALLATAITTILDDHAWREGAAIHGPAFVAERFNRERMLRETIEVYGQQQPCHSG